MVTTQSFCVIFTVYFYLSEPDHYGVNDSVTPKQMAADFSSLQKVLSDYDLKPRFIAGPDVAGQGIFFHE